MKFKNLTFLNSFVLALGLLTLLIGLTVIIGWLFDITILKSLNPDYISMKANTAICFMFSGILIIFLRDSDLTLKFRYLIRILSITVLIISATNLFEYILNWNSGIDELLFKEGQGTTATIFPGRMAINTAVCFILISSSFLLIDSKYMWGNLVSQFLALITGLISVLPQLGYAYKESDLFTFAYQTPMALNTAISFFTISIGILLLRPTTGILKLLGNDGPGGFFARRLFPVVFILPVLIIWSRMALKAAGYVFDTHDFGIIILIYGFIFVVALWKMIKSLNENDRTSKLAEDELRFSEEKYRKMFENAQDVFYQANTEGIIKEISPSILRVAGYHREELIGTLVSQFYYDPNDRDIFLNELTMYGAVWDYEIRLKNKSGKIIYTSINAHLLFDSDKNLIGIEGSFRQIDERKEFELQLRKAKEKAEENDRLKTVFLQNISHEIRTPMNAVMGFSSLLGLPGTSSEMQSSYIGIIQSSSNQLLSIINDIVDISRIEANLIKSNPSTFNLNSTLKDLFSQFRLKTTEKNISLNLETYLPDKDAFITTDHTKLIQILSNLLYNSIKFTQKGNINFGYIKKETFIEFFVTDTGIGIRPEDQLKVFDNFFQVEDPLSQQFGGTGLGLSICKGYVELLGGKIWISSEPGTGTNFYFTIPNQAFEQPSTPYIKFNKLEHWKCKKNESILVAEDDDIAFNLIKAYLKDSDLKIIRAANGEEAVERCKTYKNFNLVLMDIQMPGMDGFLATIMIKELFPELPIIAQTAYFDEREKAIISGCSDFITKPFNKELLISKIVQYLPQY
jgi:PAS domain S-box-containing protein